MLWRETHLVKLVENVGLALVCIFFFFFFLGITVSEVF